jgi:short-subunit dehydrogenase
MNSATVLHGKHAVIFGASGTIGSAVAKEFAKEGAEVFLSGRTRSNVETLAKDIA